MTELGGRPCTPHPQTSTSLGKGTERSQRGSRAGTGDPRQKCPPGAQGAWQQQDRLAPEPRGDGVPGPRRPAPSSQGTWRSGLWEGRGQVCPAPTTGQPERSSGHREVCSTPAPGTQQAPIKVCQTNRQTKGWVPAARVGLVLARVPQNSHSCCWVLGPLTGIQQAPPRPLHGGGDRGPERLTNAPRSLSY